MTRLFLPGYPLRNQKRSGRQSIQRQSRRPRLEQLDRRLVLSGITDVIQLDAPVDLGSDVQAATTSAPPVENAVTADVSAAQAETPVYLAVNGVLHVQPAADVASIVVRQFVDFRLEEVVEIEMAGQWIAVPAEQVNAVQVQLLDSNQTVDIDAGVTKPVQLVEPLATDQALAANLSDTIADAVITSLPNTSTGTVPLDASLVGLVLPSDTVATPVALLQSSPGGGIGTPPQITNFTVAREGNIWQFTGHVTDDKSVAGLIVQFGGLISSSTAVNEEGNFQFTTTFAPGTDGYVTAITTDGDYLRSNLAYCSVDYPI